MTGSIVKSLIVPAHPHPVLCPEKNEGWQNIRNAYDEARKQIEESDADLIIIYSTLWPSIIGHQLQADPNPEWVDGRFQHWMDDRIRAVHSPSGVGGMTRRSPVLPVCSGGVGGVAVLNDGNPHLTVRVLHDPPPLWVQTSHIHHRC